MTISEVYTTVFEVNLQGRFITLDHVMPLLESYASIFEIEQIGESELGQGIPMIKIGHGEKVVLAWSQMHGNESTTTKALFDFFKFCAQKDYFEVEISEFLATYSFYVIPILNPDGAKAYTRENLNGIDLNRDAQQQSQMESKALAAIFDKIKPGLCLNLHDQRTIYGAAEGKTATVSFLSPAANESRAVTPNREVAMLHIARLANMLNNYIPGMIGRYDDSFNANCVGDTFQMAGIPTVLFEAGHAAADYQRTETRAYIFYSFLELFGITKTGSSEVTVDDYYKIPENTTNFKDFILRNVCVNGALDPCDIAVQYEEVLEDEAISFVPKIDFIGDLSNYFGHKEKDGNGLIVLVNSQVNVEIGVKVSKILAKDTNSIVFFTV
ncbi:MAG: hypothetical protein ACI86C_000704 [Candidatus Latescibacterota bacterium]|jgi:hypothetical protein